MENIALNYTWLCGNLNRKYLESKNTIIDCILNTNTFFLSKWEHKICLVKIKGACIE